MDKTIAHSDRKLFGQYLTLESLFLLSELQLQMVVIVEHKIVNATIGNNYDCSIVVGILLYQANK